MDDHDFALVIHDLLFAGTYGKSCRKAEKFWNKVTGEARVYVSLEQNTIDAIVMTFSYDEEDEEAESYANKWIEVIKLINLHSIGNMRFESVRLAACKEQDIVASDDDVDLHHTEN